MKPIIIGLAGRAGAGKDTVGGIVKLALHARGEGLQLISFAEPLKKICKDVYAFTDEQMTHPKLKELGDMRYPRPDGTYLSPRESMQLLGTEWARRCYPDTWVNLGLRRAREYLNTVSVVITDCRFVNEAKAIREIGGEVWRIRRPSADVVQVNHLSETEMDSDEFEVYVNHTLYNDGTLMDLFEAVKRVMTQ